MDANELPHPDRPRYRQAGFYHSSTKDVHCQPWGFVDEGDSCKVIFAPGHRLREALKRPAPP